MDNLGNIFHFERQEHVRENISKQLRSYSIMLIFFVITLLHILYFSLSSSHMARSTVFTKVLSPYGGSGMADAQGCINHTEVHLFILPHG